MTTATTEKQKDLIVLDDAQRQAARLPTPTVSPDANALMKIIDRAAMDPNFDVAKLEQLIAVKERWEKREAEKAFNEAFAAFKAEVITVIKNKSVTDGPLKGKSYAELFSVVNAVTPLLSKHGLSHSWRLSKDEKDWIEVTCTLKHVLGHAEAVSMSGPPDAGGAKNAIQARASTITYLERYTLKAVCGVAEGGDDNDGNGSGGQMAESALADHLAAIDATASKEELMKVFGKAWRAAEELNDTRAMKKLGDRKEKRKAELGAKA
jgi:hypothetical protein